LVRGGDTLSRMHKALRSERSNSFGRRWAHMRSRKCGKSKGAVSFSRVAMSQSYASVGSHSGSA
jgi:hypothetical protein